MRLTGDVARNRVCRFVGRPRHTKPRVLALSGEILIGSAIIAISLLYASRAPRSPRCHEVAQRDEKWLKSKRNSAVGSRAANNGDTVTSGIRIVRSGTTPSPFLCIVDICYFVHIHNGVTSPHAVPMHSVSLSRCLLFFLSPCFSLLSVSTSTDTNQWLSSINVRR